MNTKILSFAAGAVCMLQAGGATLGNPHCLVYCEESGQHFYELDPKEPDKPYALVWADGEDSAAIPILDDDGGAIVPVVTPGTADASWLGAPEIHAESDFKDAPGAIFFFEDDASAIRALDACNAFDGCRAYVPDRRWILVKIKQTSACKTPATFKVGIQGSSETRTFYVIPEKWGWDRALKWIDKNAEILPEWKKARVLNGVCMDSAFSVTGTAELKCGKANKQGFAKVSMKITPFSGKKTTYKANNVNVSAAANPDGFVSFQFGNGNTIQIDPPGVYFEGDINNMIVMSASIGGDFTGTHTMYLPQWNSGVWGADVPAGSEPALASAAGFLDLYWRGFCAANFSHTMTFTASGSKWTFARDEIFGTPDIKISYKKKTGLFSGSAKIVFNNTCMANPTGENPKKLSLKMKGVVYNGAFAGTMTYKKSFSTPIAKLNPLCILSGGEILCTGALDEPVYVDYWP